MENDLFNLARKRAPLAVCIPGSDNDTFRPGYLLGHA